MAKKRIYYYHISCEVSSIFLYCNEPNYERTSIIKQYVLAHNETDALMKYMEHFLCFNTMKTLRVFTKCLFCNKTDRYGYEDI